MFFFSISSTEFWSKIFSRSCPVFVFHFVFLDVVYLGWHYSMCLAIFSQVEFKCKRDREREILLFLADRVTMQGLPRWLVSKLMQLTVAVVVMMMILSKLWLWVVYDNCSYDNSVSTKTITFVMRVMMTLTGRRKRILKLVMREGWKTLFVVIKETRNSKEREESNRIEAPYCLSMLESKACEQRRKNNEIITHQALCWNTLLESVKWRLPKADRFWEASLLELEPVPSATSDIFIIIHSLLQKRLTREITLFYHFYE